MFIYILIIIILIISVLVVIYLSSYNKIQFCLIKIEEAEKSICSLLRKKLECIIEINSFIESKKEENKLMGLEDIEKKELNNYELSSALDKYNKKILEITNFSKEIIFDDEEEKKIKELEKINIDLLASENYYNDNANEFNKLICKFPTKIVSKFCKYNEKELYLNKKEEIFEILRDE